MIQNLVARVFAARNAAHLAHWSTRSYAQHVALDEFYNDVIGAIDAVVEHWQGQFGLMGSVEVTPVDNKNMLAVLAEDANWIDENRAEIANGSAPIENLIDELANVYQKTLYKLRFLS